MTKAICIRYILVFIATLAIIGIISFILQSYFQIDIGSGGTIVSIIIPALDAGTAYYNKTGESPSTKVRWAFARYFTAIQFIFAAVFLAIAWNFIPELSALTSSVGLTVLLVFSAFYLILILLTSRYFFGTGIKSAEKVANRMTKR